MRLVSAIGALPLFDPSGKRDVIAFPPALGEDHDISR
jgi:hypothetical protein